ncbi:MAG: tetratricopeptide repeat protein, partial [Gemmatimonadales bacterium]
MRPFLAELKRRKVVRVAIVYVLVGLVVVEAANNLFPALNLPDWTVTLVVALALLGFPIALALAWAFDITPARVKRAAGEDAGADERSIAVLPFTDMSPEGDQEYLCDGMAEELIDALTKVKELRVAARTSSFQFKGRSEDVCEIGKKLRVGSVLEGSVRRAGERLRVTAQLVNAADGYHLWSEKYERKLEDVFAIQDDIARAIVGTLRVTLLGEQQQPLVRAGTESSEAYDLYLKGRHCWVRRYKYGLQTALEFFEKANETDPGYALPYTGIADVHSILAIYGLLEPGDARRIAEAAAERALALDPELPEAYFSRAVVRACFYHEWDTSHGLMQRAVELNPIFAAAHAWIGMALANPGLRVEEGLEHARRACALDPHSPYIQGIAGLAHIMGRRYPGAIAHFERALKLEPEDVLALYGAGTCYSAVGRHAEAIATLEKAAALSHRMAFVIGLLAAAYGRAGMMAEARVILQELRERAEREYVTPVALAWACANVGLEEEALDYLEQALAESHPTLSNAIRYPVWDAILSHPRY